MNPDGANGTYYWNNSSVQTKIHLQIIKWIWEKEYKVIKISFNGDFDREFFEKIGFILWWTGADKVIQNFFTKVYEYNIIPPILYIRIL